MPLPQIAMLKAETRTKLHVHNSMTTAVWEHQHKSVKWQGGGLRSWISRSQVWISGSLTTQPSSFQSLEREVQIPIVLNSSKSRG